MKRPGRSMVLSILILGVTAGLVGSCGPSSPYRSEKQVYRDTEIETDIMSQFQQVHGLTEVTAISARGEVTLTGEVDDPLMAKKAEELVLSVSRVKKVTNQITVRTGPGDRVK